MIKLSSLIGNEAVKAVLERETACQSFLIEGEVGSGRHTLAELLTRAAVCKEEQYKPCGHCEACRKALAGAHIDIVSIPSDAKTEELRAYLETVAVFPNDGKKKVYIIDNAERLGAIQQNVLLKTLEEPPEYAVFILICVSREGLLPTIRSRCMILTTEPVSEADMRAYLRARFPQAEEARLTSAVGRAGGCIGKAVQELEAVKSDFYEKVEALAQAVLTERYDVLITRLAAEKDRNEFRRILGGMHEWFNRRLIDKAVGGSAVGEAEQAACRLSAEKLSAFCAVFSELEEKATLNVNLPLWCTATARKCYEIHNPAGVSAENRR